MGCYDCKSLTSDSSRTWQPRSLQPQQSTAVQTATNDHVAFPGNATWKTCTKVGPHACKKIILGPLSSENRGVYIVGLLVFAHKAFMCKASQFWAAGFSGMCVHAHVCTNPRAQRYAPQGSQATAHIVE